MAQFTFRNDAPALTDKFTEHKNEINQTLASLNARLDKLTEEQHEISNKLDQCLKMTLMSDPDSIALVENQTDKLCMLAIRAKPSALQYIKNKKFEYCFEAVNLDCDALKFCPFDKFTKNQIESLCVTAVHNGGEALMFVPYEYRTDNLCLDAIKEYNANTVATCVPTEFEYTDTWMQVWRSIVYANPRNICLLEENKEMYELLVNYAFKRDWHAIEYIKDLYITDDMLIEYIHNYPQALWKKKGRIFVLSKNPSNLVKRVMHFKDWKMLK